jgi:hypothetical protein
MRHGLLCSGGRNEFAAFLLQALKFVVNQDRSVTRKSVRLF